MIPREVIDDIARKADIVQVISNYIQVIKKGNSYLAICPFHDDKNPSLHISQTKQIYKCFSCGAAGNVFTFVQDYEKVSFIEAVQKVASLINYDYHFEEDEKRKVDDDTKKILKAINDACNIYHYSLDAQAGIAGREYLKNRNISDEMINYFKLGFSPSNGESTIKLLRSKGNDIVSLDNAGINIHINNTFQDRFKNRLMFPIFNEYNEPIGFSGRIIDKSDEAKYVNSPSTKVFNKSSVLYNYQNAKNEAKRANYCYVVEGFMDVFSLYRIGIKSCVALMGTAFTNYHAKMLKHLNVEIRLFLDGDDPGQHGMLSMIELLDKERIPYKFVNYGDINLDPDEIFNQLGGDKLKEVASKLINKSQFVINYYEKRCDISSVEGKKEFTLSVSKFFNHFDDEIEYEAILKRISEVIKISTNAIRNVFKYISDNKSDYSDIFIQGTKSKSRVSRLKSSQKQLIYCMINSQSAREYISNLPNVVFIDDVYNIIANYIIELGQENPQFEFSELISRIQTNNDNKGLVQELINISIDKQLTPNCSKEAIDEYVTIAKKAIDEKIFNDDFYNDYFSKDEIERAKMLDRKKGVN